MVTMMNPIDEQPATDSTSTHPSPLPPSSVTNPPSQPLDNTGQPSHIEEPPGSNGVVYWLDGRTGDQLTAPPSSSSSRARFMRSTYAATCRAHLSRSIERCPRAMRGIHVRLSFSLCVFLSTNPHPSLMLTIGVLRMLLSNCRVLRVRSRVSSGNAAFRPSSFSSRGNRSGTTSSTARPNQ